MNKYTVMPLLNSSFEPGKAREIVAGFEDMDVRPEYCPGGAFLFHGRS